MILCIFLCHRILLMYFIIFYLLFCSSFSLKLQFKTEKENHTNTNTNDWIVAFVFIGDQFLVFIFFVFVAYRDRKEGSTRSIEQVHIRISNKSQNDANESKWKNKTNADQSKYTAFSNLLTIIPIEERIWISVQKIVYNMHTQYYRLKKKGEQFQICSIKNFKWSQFLR